MWYRSNMDRVWWPDMTIATRSEIPALTIFRTGLPPVYWTLLVE